jgi:hypothetical protein
MPFVENTKIYDMNRLERNIIIGSLLGDGSLALYGKVKMHTIENMDTQSKFLIVNGKLINLKILTLNF